MIPTGQNPHGLENKTISYHVFVSVDDGPLNEIEFESGEPSTIINRKYCWAEIPKVLRDNYGIMWSDRFIPLKSDYYVAQKYVSKKMEDINPDSESPYWATSENGYKQIMVNGDLDLYIELWINYKYPEYATVYILDTSGSMGGDDYNSVKRSITGSMWEYRSQEWGVKDAKTWVYNGTYTDNIGKTGNILGDLHVNDSDVTARQLYDLTDKLINGIPKRSTSEAMVSCLYWAIADIQKNVIVKQPIGEGYLKGITFILCTNESIFTSDTLDGWRKISEKFAWFSKWQSSSSNKFPTTVPASSNQVDFSNSITNALKQMSLYYGINMTWALTKDITEDYSRLQNNVPFVAQCSVDRNYAVDGVKVGKITFTGGKCWMMPSGYHITYPYSYMCQVIVEVPSTIDLTTSKALSNAITMADSDQYTSQAKIRGKWHMLSNRQYCTFRYWTSDQTVVLPSTSNTNVSYSGYYYKWVRIDGSGHEVSGSEQNQGSTYTISKSHEISYSNTKSKFGNKFPGVILFRLKRYRGDMITMRVNSNSNRTDLWSEISPDNVDFPFGTVQINGSNKYVDIAITKNQHYPEVPVPTCSKYDFDKWLLSNAKTGNDPVTPNWYWFPSGHSDISDYVASIADGEEMAYLWAQWKEKTAPFSKTVTSTFQLSLIPTDYYSSHTDLSGYRHGGGKPLVNGITGGNGTYTLSTTVLIYHDGTYNHTFRIYPTISHSKWNDGIKYWLYDDNQSYFTKCSGMGISPSNANAYVETWKPHPYNKTYYYPHVVTEVTGYRTVNITWNGLVIENMPSGEFGIGFEYVLIGSDHCNEKTYMVFQSTTITKTS